VSQSAVANVLSINIDLVMVCSNDNVYAGLMPREVVCLVIHMPHRGWNGIVIHISFNHHRAMRTVAMPVMVCSKVTTNTNAEPKILVRLVVMLLPVVALGRGVLAMMRYGRSMP
jgi:hypothetical protein